MTLGPISSCPNCGYDPTGDESEYTSGGGWFRDTSFVNDMGELVHVTEFKCPTCRTTIDREENGEGMRR